MYVEFHHSTDQIRLVWPLGDQLGTVCLPDGSVAVTLSAEMAQEAVWHLRSALKDWEMEWEMECSS